MNYDKVYIINLEYRKDRKEHIIKELKKVNISNYVFFKAIKLNSIDDINKWNKDFAITKPSWLKKMSEEQYMKYRLGSLGCLLSHIEVLKDAEKNNYNNIIILEDDAFFDTTINFDKFLSFINKQIINTNTSVDLFYFGGKNHGKNVEFISKNIIKTAKTAALIAYLINKKTRKYIIENIKNYDKEIDVYYINEIQEKFNCYALYPFIVYQKPNNYSDIINITY